MTEARNVERLPAIVEDAPRHQVPAFLIPDSLDAIATIADKFCRASWVPKSYCDRNGTPDKAAVEVGIMAGLTLGLPPLSALQSIAVINGNPSLWGDGMLAVVWESGLMEEFDEAFEKDPKSGDDPGEGLVAICTVKRRGRNPQCRRFSQAMAKKAGLWDKQGPWKSYPQRMLQMRARSWALRDVFADVLKGMHSAEEMVDMGVVYSAPVAPPPRVEDYTDAVVDDSKPYMVASIDGTETECTADELAKALDKAMGECGTEDQLHGIWESFGGSETLVKLADEGRGDVVEVLNLTWQGQAERIAKAIAKTAAE